MYLFVFTKGGSAQPGRKGKKGAPGKPVSFIHNKEKIYCCSDLIKLHKCVNFSVCQMKSKR